MKLELFHVTEEFAAIVILQPSESGEYTLLQPVSPGADGMAKVYSSVYAV
ncbi:MAG: hypothetical protein JST27_07095 [Bacteroidetes bacterium]|nr:hypothetical protein [Bacteroidota bacterium]